MKLVIFNETPPGLWKYLCPETNKWVPDPATFGGSGYYAYMDMVDAVKSHMLANKVPIPGDIEERIQDQICRSIPAKFCVDDKGHHQRDRNWLFTMQSVIQGTATLVDWALSSSEKVSQEEVVRRSDICSRCQFNQNPGDCMTCGQRLGDLMGLISRISSGPPLPSDSSLKSCQICGCHLRAKTRVPRDVILRHMPEYQQRQLPEHCWLKG